MKFWIASIAAVAALGVGSAAFAQTMSPTDKASWPTVACRVPMKGDVANAKMGAEAMTCKTIDYAKAKAVFMQMMKDASASGTPTQAQIDAAYNKAFGNAMLLGHPQ